MRIEKIREDAAFDCGVYHAGPGGRFREEGCLPEVQQAGGIAEREGLAHDACNLLAAVGLYCDLMSRPGVMNPGYQHYLDEMRRLAERSEGLIERMMPRAVPEDARERQSGATGLTGVTGMTGMTMSGATMSSGVTILDPAGVGDMPSSPLTAGRTAARLEDPELRVIRELRALDGLNVGTEIVLAGPGRRGQRVRDAVESAAGAPAVVNTPGADVTRLMAEAGEMLQLLSGPGVQVEMKSLLPEGVVLGASDESLLRVLLNLTVNARDAMPQGGRLRIAAQWCDWEDGAGCDAGDAVLISVQDSGVGMPVYMVAAINLGVAAPKRRQQGDRSGRLHGLGLEIVRELVTAAGGRMRVLSAAMNASGDGVDAISAGTRFEIVLPVWRKADSGLKTETAGHPVAEVMDTAASVAGAVDKRENGRARMTGTRKLQLVSPRSDAWPEPRGNETAKSAAKACSERGTAIC